MKTFLQFIGKILGLLLLVALLLDGIYTTIFTHSSQRNKVEQVLHTTNKNYDVVFLGTSRANNHFVTELVEKQGYTAFNYGMSGSHLYESALLLKVMLANNWKIKNIIIETDLNLSNEKRDDGTFALFMPYLHQNALIKKHVEQEPDFVPLYYVPFYRYLHFDAKIGSRACYKTLVKEPTNTLQNGGYYALGHNPKANMKNNIEKLIPLKNKYFEEIKYLCQQHQIQLHAVSTPMCSNVKGMAYFEKIQHLYPELHLMEDYVTDDVYFSSCGHLNDKGARLFTEKMLEKIEEKLKK